MAKSRISSMPTMVDGPASNEFNSETTKQWLVACCEKQVDVYLLTSMHRLYYQKFDGVHLIKAEIVTVDNGPFVVGYFSTGRIVAYSLPSLRLLMDTNFFPADDVRSADKLIDFYKSSFESLSDFVDLIERFNFHIEVTDCLCDRRQK